MVTEKGTEPRKVLSWGKGETATHVPTATIIAGWVCVVLVYLFAVPFFSPLAVWVLLALAIALIRDENKVARINGWIFVPLFVLKVVAMLVHMFAT